MRSRHKHLMQCVAAAVSYMLAAPAMPQEPAPQQGDVIKSRVTLINIFATVRDKKKHIIPGLNKEDFQVFEDDQEQKIAFFSSERALPITLGLLIDTSLSEENRLGAEQEAASGFLNQVLRKGDEAMVISFGADVDLLSDFTDDRAQLDRAIRHARINAPNASIINAGPLPPDSSARGLRGTAFYDAVYLACGDKLGTEAGRKALVIITDAEDNGSKVRLEEAIEAAERADAVVHILLVHDPVFYGWRPDVARKMADATGGRVIEVSSEKHLREAFDQIAEELRDQYTLGYYPTNSSADGKFRKIKIEMANHDLKVLARKGYYAPRG
jgi:VWFA-related protein